MSESRFLRAACMSIAAFVAVLGDAAAQPTQAQQSAIRSSCRNDFPSVCAGVQAGGSAALQCLQQNAARVSPACQQALGAVSGGGAPANASAGAGAAAAAAPGTAAPMQQQGMQQQGMQMQPGGAGGGRGMTMRDELRLTREACGQDFRTYCQGVQMGGGRGVTCLESNARSLSPGCQQALMAAKQQMGR